MKEAKSDVIRWRRSTWRSRLVVYAMLAAMLLYLAWTETADGEGGPPWWLGLVIVVGIFALRPLIRRWQVEVISPRPQTPEHKRAYRRLQWMQVGLLAGFAVPFLWLLWTPAHSRAHTMAAILGALGLAAFIVSQPFFTAAYQRLFRKIAQTEGAYGF
jgi:MYXO-CTERM domain-containing protein